jgi:multiple sugar transport system substrate-binding protein
MASRNPGANAPSSSVWTRRQALKAGGASALAMMSGFASQPSSAANGELPRGKTITVAVGSFMSSGINLFVDSWEKKTGNKVNVVQIPYGNLYTRLSTAFASGSQEFDIAVYAANWAPEFAVAGSILELDPYYAQKKNWDTVVGQVQRAMYVRGKRYTTPLDGDIIFGYYRKDALENPKYQKKFEEKFGYPLAPPSTWQQYKDISTFFTGWEWGATGQKGWGNLAARKPQDAGLYLLAAQASAYGANPKSPGTLFFDPETLEPQVNNPAWVQALQDWIELKASAPAQQNTYGHGDMMGNWCAGDYALAVNWADLGVIAQDTTSSIVQGKIGYFILPGSKKVWNTKTKSWDELAEPNHAPFMAFGGWKGSVSAKSPNPALAFDFLDWVDSDANSFTAVTTPGTARNPYRKQHFADVKGWTTAPTKYDDPGSYLSTMQASFDHPNAQSDLRILKAGRYLQALDNWVQQGFAGAMPAQNALDKAAAEWKEITASVDFKTQQSLYRDMIGMTA